MLSIYFLLCYYLIHQRETSMLEKQLLDKLFEYKDGVLYRKIAVNRMPAGVKAGVLRKSDGYIHIRIKGKKYLAHRLIFFMFYGFMPKNIDHINNNRLDNSILNLRAASDSENRQNSKSRTDNTSGIKGVSWYNRLNCWRVQIGLNKKIKHIGYFIDLDLAELVAIEARNKYHGVFANHA